MGNYATLLHWHQRGKTIKLAKCSVKACGICCQLLAVNTVEQTVFGGSSCLPHHQCDGCLLGLTPAHLIGCTHSALQILARWTQHSYTYCSTWQQAKLPMLCLEQMLVHHHCLQQRVCDWASWTLSATSGHWPKLMCQRTRVLSIVAQLMPHLTASAAAAAAAAAAEMVPAAAPKAAPVLRTAAAASPALLLLAAQQQPSMLLLSPAGVTSTTTCHPATPATWRCPSGQQHTNWQHKLQHTRQLGQPQILQPHNRQLAQPQILQPQDLPCLPICMLSRASGGFSGDCMGCCMAYLSYAACRTPQAGPAAAAESLKVLPAAAAAPIQ